MISQQNAQKKTKKALQKKEAPTKLKAAEISLKRKKQKKMKFDPITPSQRLGDSKLNVLGEEKLTARQTESKKILPGTC